MNWSCTNLFLAQNSCKPRTPCTSNDKDFSWELHINWRYYLAKFMFSFLKTLKKLICKSQVCNLVKCLWNFAVNIMQLHTLSFFAMLCIKLQHVLNSLCVVKKTKYRKKSSAYLMLVFIPIIEAKNPKICIISKSNEPFLRAEQDCPEKCCQRGRIGCAI